MRTRALAATVAAAAVVVGVAACSPSEESSDATHDMSSMSHAATSTSQDASAQANSTKHNDADVMFAQMMLPHHQQALVMSDIVLGKKDVPADVTKLATQIKDAQGPEIAQLKSWLKAWGAPEQQHMDHQMDGMLSDADLDKLRAADGTAAAKLFLTQMIEHHEGAVKMAQSEVTDGQNADAIAMAKAIVDSQQKEIDQMRTMLKGM